MLVKNLSCPNQENTNYMYRLPFNTCCTSDTLGINFIIDPCDDTANRSKVTYNKCGKDLKCEIDDETKNELKKNIKGELEKDLKCKCIEEEITEKITKEVDKSGCNRRGCENAREDGEYVNVGSDAKLYIRKALDKFYPDLSAEIIDKIKAGDYYVEQFGIKVTNCDKNGTDSSYITTIANRNKVSSKREFWIKEGRKYRK
ncbi:hypothetical protein [Wolbachia endosymbiont (group A) of Colletes cunicularius]|uniref:hypothetical protein n=1 Tax=Wolbachia endosymbiont (group A) of Colletes cunicularius TaxID=3139321 RepID=UPI0035C93458